MCEHGNTTLVKLCRPRKVSGRTEVPVDSCIAPLVQALNDLGIETMSACCGHGETPASIMINMSDNIFRVETINYPESDIKNKLVLEFQVKKKLEEKNGQKDKRLSS